MKHSDLAWLKITKLLISGQRKFLISPKLRLTDWDTLFSTCVEKNYSYVEFETQHFAVLICRIHAMTECPMISVQKRFSVLVWLLQNLKIYSWKLIETNYLKTICKIWWKKSFQYRKKLHQTEIGARNGGNIYPYCVLWEDYTLEYV